MGPIGSHVFGQARSAKLLPKMAPVPRKYRPLNFSITRSATLGPSEVARLCSHRKFDPVTGGLVLLVENANPSGTSGVYPPFRLGDFHGLVGLLPSPDLSTLGRYSSGGESRTTFVLDLLGRVRQTTALGGPLPSGSAARTNVNAYVTHELQPIAERPNVLYYCETSLPQKLTGAFSGAAERTWFNAAATPIGRSGYSLATSGDYAAPTFVRGSLLSCQRVDSSRLFLVLCISRATGGGILPAINRTRPHTRV